MAAPLVQVYKSEGRWYWMCHRCHASDGRGDYREITKLAHRHIERHVGVGFSPPKR